MLDDTHWPATSALIDEACGLTGQWLMVGEGPQDDVRGLFVELYYRGQRREDLEREHLENYHAIDERVPALPATAGPSLGAHHRPVHGRGVEDLTDLQRHAARGPVCRDSLNVRLPWLDRSHIAWGLNDPVDSDGWGSSRITMVQRLMPHIQQFVCVRQALVRGGARP